MALAFLGYHARQLARPPALYGFLTAPHETTQLLGAVMCLTVFPGRAPEGEVLISARLGGARHPEALALDDPRLIALAHRELAPLLSIRGEPTSAHLVRHARALPQYTLGHAARVAELDAAEREWPGLHFTGNAYRGLGVPDCLGRGGALCRRDRAVRTACADPFDLDGGAAPRSGYAGSFAESKSCAESSARSVRTAIRRLAPRVLHPESQPSGDVA